MKILEKIILPALVLAGVLVVPVEGQSNKAVVSVTMQINKRYANAYCDILIDDANVAYVTNDEEVRFEVSDGPHKIRLKLSSIFLGISNELTFMASSNVVSFSGETNWFGKTTIKFIGATPRGSASSGAKNSESNSGSVSSSAKNSKSNSGSASDAGVESTLIEAVGLLMAKIPSKSKVAIVNVAASDPEVSEFIAGELEFIMVDNGLTVIDRSELDRIRREQSFQMSGEVDDSQAVSIGKIAGANVILTGAVTGSGDLRRLRLRALSTETGQVLAAASEKF